MKNDDLGVLAETGWLAAQPAAFREAVRTLGRWRVFEPGQFLYHVGDPCDGVYGLAEGALECTLPLVGDEPVTFHRAEPGFWIGESGLLAGTTRLMSVCVVRRSRVFFIPAREVRAMLAMVPERWQSFYALSHANVSLAVGLLAEVLSLSPAARLARRLRQLADTDGTVDVSQVELAALVGVTRGTVKRALDLLIAEGVVETGYRTIRIRDRAGLERIANTTAD